MGIENRFMRQTVGDVGSKATADGRLEHALKLAMQERSCLWFHPGGGYPKIRGKDGKRRVTPQKCWAQRF